jgi:hypothetical protein
MASASNYLANGTIRVSRVVKVDATAGKNFMVIEASASTDKPVGVAQDGSHDAPGLTGATVANAATAGLPLRVYQDGEECLGSAGAAVTHGDWLKSDANGQLIPIAGTEGAGNFIVGRALEDAAGANVLFRMRVQVQAYRGST